VKHKGDTYPSTNFTLCQNLSTPRSLPLPPFWHMSNVRCQLSDVRCQLSDVRCQALTGSGFLGQACLRSYSLICFIRDQRI
jgi:hypothetical protein